MIGLISTVVNALIANSLLSLLKLLERDMEPHIERMHIQQEQIQLLPSLIGAVTVKEQSSETLPTTTYQCVDRLLADMEHLEDRIEALNEIMDAQRQRVSCLSRFTLYFHYEMNHINGLQL